MERTRPVQQKSSLRWSGPAREVPQLGQDRVQQQGGTKIPPLLCGVGNAVQDGNEHVYAVWVAPGLRSILYTEHRDK